MKAKKQYRNVSKRMGLDRLIKATPKTCMARAREIERRLKSGKIPSSLRETAMRWIYTYRSRARILKA